MKKQIILITLTLITILVSVSAVSAADWYVNASASSGGDGLSWATAYQNIGDGVDATSADGDKVIIAPGTYTGSSNKNMDVNYDITIQGAGQDQTIIDLQGSGRAFYIDEADVIIKGLTIKNGNGGSEGGAISTYDDSKLTVINCKFINNTADEGGAINVEDDGTYIVNNCTFIGNHATGAGGGAIYNDEGSLTVTGSIFNGNTATNDGGAIFIEDQSHTSTITGCNFNKNTATNDGGAIYIDYTNDVTTKYSRFVGNTAGDDGQDIFVYYNEDLIATLNWWGSNTGPATGKVMTGSEGTFDVSSKTYTPWLVMNILPADPSTIYTGETSKITVNVYTDSNGVDHSADASQFFSGPEVTFTTDLGNVGSKSVTVDWVLGQAFATLRGDEGPGLATVTATDASTTLSTTVTILQAPTANAATVGMQKTGLPIAGLVLAILAVLGGSLAPKRK